MGFPIKLFTIQGNLVFMNNLYHKIAVASVCTVLGFALGANTEAKAAILSLESTISSGIIDFGSDGLGDLSYDEFSTSPVIKGLSGEAAQFNEFNIGSFSFAPNTVINSAVLQVEIYSIVGIDLGINTPTNPGSLGIFGYVGNGTLEVSDFEAGIFLNSVDISSSSTGDILSFDVSPFVNQRVSNGDAFAGFGIRALNFGGLYLNNYASPGIKPRLIVETAEPVPEPTTIFGSAILLGVGGWLKRKKSTAQNKAKPQA
jgi:hypothetical protein